MDQNPRYHISSGDYLSRIYQQCICCPWPKVNCIVPADISLPYRYFRAAEQSWRLQRIEQEAKRITSLIELQNAPMGVVHAWIDLQDYTKRETIDQRALALQIWDHNQRAVFKLNSPVTNRQDREQLEQMTTEELCIWIRSKGYPVSYAKPARDIEPPVCKKTLLNRALEVQDALERKSGMITDLHNTLITRTDLGKMCTKELVGWIGSKGFSARSYVIQKKSQTLYVLSIAEKVWDFLSSDISDRHLCVRFGLKMNRTSTYDEVGLARKTHYALLAKDTFKAPEGQRLSPVEPQNHLLMHQFPDGHQYTSGPSEEEIPSGFQEEHQRPQNGLRGLTNSVPEKLQENRLFSVGISIP
jgi:hypothetical protein